MHVREGGEMPDPAFLQTMAGMTAKQLREYSDEWLPLQQWQINDPPTPVPATPPEGMALIPAGSYHFVSRGLIPQGDQLPEGKGVDVQFPWEEWPRREHEQTLELHEFFIDKHLVTNSDYLQFLQQSGYSPPVSAQSWLQHWGGADTYPAGHGAKPVVYVSRADAAAFCSFYGKRTLTGTLLSSTSSGLSGVVAQACRTRGSGSMRRKGMMVGCSLGETMKAPQAWSSRRHRPSDRAILPRTWAATRPASRCSASRT